MSHSIQDAKALDGSILEKDAQAGAIEDVNIDPVAEKKVSASYPVLGVSC